MRFLHLARAWPALALLAAALACPSHARADFVLFYNGNYNGVDATSNQVGGDLANTVIYDDFVVPVGFTWTISQVYSNNFMDFTPTTAHYDIRRGVSAGVAGTSVFSGNAAATVTPTGATLNQYSESKVSVSGLNITLQAGRYFLSVAPIGTGGVVSYLSQTSGSGGVGLAGGVQGNSFINSVPADFNYNYLPTNDPSFLGAGVYDYSMGVIGVATPLASAVPEPSTLTMSGLMIVTAGSVQVFRRRRRRAAA